jgi:hypothetical protein
VFGNRGMRSDGVIFGNLLPLIMLVNACEMGRTYAKPFQAAASMGQTRRHWPQFSLPLFATLFEFKTSKA